ncbi:MAG: ABC transporter ATP-binding protein [Planctomycetes bacterium]|nr:ABC transporter ATP-binding protein [Planctomycetota bacterium]
MISVSHLTRTFGDFTALDDVSFEIAKGEVVGFLGPNGAGKTTTLRILAGYLPATSGTARVAGFDVLRDSIEVRRRIGYLPESVPLYREHRVIEMLEFQARLHGMSRADTRRRVGEVLQQVGLTDRSRDLVGHLSRGLRQRAGLAVALLPDPEVLILDEPTSGLDPLQRIEVRALVRELATKHTVILSSHILPEIEATCPRVVILHEGRLVADGTPDQLVRAHSEISHVRLEAVLGADAPNAAKFLRAIAGVREVVDRGRLGIHHQFDIVCDEDLREDVGALAAARKWALRELSWRRPTLEQLFSRIAIGGSAVTAAHPPGSSAGTADPATTAGTASVPLHVSLPLSSAAPQPGKSAPAKIVYNLNPFDQGATRHLGTPKAVEGQTPSAAEQRARESGGE